MYPLSKPALESITSPVYIIHIQYTYIQTINLTLCGMWCITTYIIENFNTKKKKLCELLFGNLKTTLKDQKSQTTITKNFSMFLLLYISTT